MPQQIIGGIATALVLGGIGVLLYFGERRPTIEVDADGIRIRAMYGRRIDFPEITGVTLLEQSMWKIGTGLRYNGYGGLSLKGHFRVGLLFAEPHKAPTIRIERSTKKPVYISFRDAAQTRLLYDELSKAWAAAKTEAVKTEA